MIKINKPKSIWLLYTIILLGGIGGFSIVMICEKANPILVAMVGFIVGIIGVRALAPHDIYEKGRWKPDIYSNFIHPLSLVYVYLFPQKILEKSEKQLREYLGYVVEEECFWTKIEEWGWILQNEFINIGYGIHVHDS